MVGRAAIALLLCALTARAQTPKPAAKKRRIEIHLRSVDAARREAIVEIVGVSRPPAPNLFTFTDVRERHFVAMTIHCDEPDEGKRTCRLELPAGYEKQPLASLVMHVGGLKGRTVAVALEEIEAAKNAPPPSSAPDGGATDAESR